MSGPTILSIERRRDFVAKVLAPLPADVEQVDDKRFQKALKEDAKDVWYRGMLRVWSAEHLHEHLNVERIIVLRTGGCAKLASITSSEAWNGYIREIDRQMAIPAHDKAALDWKCKRLKVGAFKEATERRQALITADEARLRATQTGGR